MKLKLIILMMASLIYSCSNNKPKGDNLEMVTNQLEKYAPTVITYDENLLDKNQKIVVKKLYEAAKIIDEIYLEQVYSRNKDILKELQNNSDKDSKKLLKFFKINFGPFDRLQHDKPFIGEATKPDGANFYPEDMTKQEFGNWIESHPEDEKSFTSEFTIIRRNDGALKAIPYSEFYKEKLNRIAMLLKDAATFADNQSLKKFLLSRADAFLSNDYFQSDMDWMDLKDHTIEIVIGPYEVYEDALFNYKASFECFLTIVDPVESKKLKIFASYLDEMERNLPIDNKYKNFGRGSESPIVVVQEVFSAGDTKAGIQTLAFNLPNDERVRKAKGSKKVMLKNINEAKFKKLLIPIAEKILPEDLRKFVTFNGFFNHTLMHEMSHGVGPGFITVNGKKTEVKKELKEKYSTLEECKADVLGIFNNILMIKKGVYPKEFEKELYTTFIVGILRSVRFGINEAHGGSNAIIFNFLLENNAFSLNQKSGIISINYDNFYSVLKQLATKLLMIQAEGDYSAAKIFTKKYVVNSESMKILVDKLNDLPIDIKPIFEITKNESSE